MKLARQTIASGYHYEETYGYSRAVRAGAQIFVSGTTARAPRSTAPTTSKQIRI
jgi:enamine deaminase RidA (YjgF/YER057c/UK114 family)